MHQIRSLLLVVLSIGYTGVVSSQTNVSSLFLPRQTKQGIETFRCEQSLSGGQTYSAKFEISGGFSCFGVGFDVAFPMPLNARIRVNWRSFNGEELTDWQHAGTEFLPSEVADRMYRTNALFTWDAAAHEWLELEFSFPVGVKAIEVNLFNGFSAMEPAATPSQSEDCLSFPSIIIRESWCGGSAACAQVLAPYTVTYINPTHSLIHHGASPQTYSNGASVVQSYWNYHVNTLGWLDIGYNYLLDHQGNLYQGRYNPQMPLVDVRAAHAGASNNGSIGVCFLGDLDASPATAPQLNTLYQLLGWWYDHRGFDPLSSAPLVTQAFGTQTIPRISGHRDVNPTACPSDNLYAQLPAIRTSVSSYISAALAACAGPSDCASSCGVGTVWDDDSATCIVASPSNYCGEGTVWDASTEQCVGVAPDCQADLNGDGMVSVADVLIVLSAFGEVCE